MIVTIALSILAAVTCGILHDKHVPFLTAGWAHSASDLAGFIGGIVLRVKTWGRRAGTPTAP